MTLPQYQLHEQAIAVLKHQHFTLTLSSDGTSFHYSPNENNPDIKLPFKGTTHLAPSFVKEHCKKLLAFRNAYAENVFVIEGWLEQEEKDAKVQVRYK